VRLAVLTLKSKKKNKVFLYCLIESVNIPYTNAQINLYVSVSVVHMELQ